MLSIFDLIPPQRSYHVAGPSVKDVVACNLTYSGNGLEPVFDCECKNTQVFVRKQSRFASRVLSYGLRQHDVM